MRRFLLVSLALILPVTFLVAKGWREHLANDNLQNHKFTIQTTLENHSTNQSVSVGLKNSKEGFITPEYQLFGLMNPSNLNFNIIWDYETVISGVYRLTWDDDYYYLDSLSINTDYSISESILTVYSTYILSQEPEEYEWLDFVVEFGSGSYSWFGIYVIPSTLPYLIPETLAYDLSNPGDVFTNVIYMYSESITSISGMIEEVDYHIEGSWLFVHNSFLSANLTSAGQESQHEVTFDTGDVADLTIIAIQSGVTNATINPSTATYFNDVPDYQDVVITWNAASAVTGLMVTVNWGGWEYEQFEWPYYEVTDLGDGTALLRIFFDDEGDDDIEKAIKSQSKDLYYSYVTIEVSYDVGSPSYFFLTIIEEFFNVYVTVQPENAGWIYGAWDYMPGDEVWLEAEPNWGYTFSHWENSNGEVISDSNPYMFTMPSEDVYIVAVFVEADFFTVTYEVVGYNGDMYASVNDMFIYSGTPVSQGQDVYFYAYPWWGYGVKEWKVNGVILEGFTQNTYIHFNLQGDLHVTVEYQEVEYPSIEPYYQYFGLNDPTDVEFTINWGSESSISSISYYGWDYYMQLQEGIDYYVNDNILTITSAFILSQNPNIYQWMDFEVQFNSGLYAWFGIVVVPSTSPSLFPDLTYYDLTNPGDVFTNILYLTANEVVSITHAGGSLVNGVDYHIEGSWLFIHNSFLGVQLTSAGNEIDLTVFFDTGAEANLTILAIESGIINATIDPTTATYTNNLPYYQDITITWNGASQVTQLMVTVFDGWSFEQFEYPYYSVTDYGNGTALLRIFFDEDKSTFEPKKGTKDEDYIYVTFEISFDAGAPAYFYMTLIWEYFNVFVTVEPYNAGWVWGDGEYSPGEEVWLEAMASWGYSFSHWAYPNGEVASTNNPYIFYMPENDVSLTAVFVPAEYYTVTFEVLGGNGYLEAYSNGYYIYSGEQVPENSEIYFWASPAWGYSVKEWKVNGEVVSNYTYNYLVVDSLHNDIHVSVEFHESTTFTVTFQVVGYGGYLEAYSGGSWLYSGSEVNAGWDVFFYASPYWGYAVKEWKVNGVVVDNLTDGMYIHWNLQSNINVTVEFKEFDAPYIAPDFQLFGLDNPADVEFTIHWGSETEIAQISFYDWNDSTRYQVVLEEGIDYFIDGDLLTIKSSFILSQNPDPFDWMYFDVMFGSGWYSWFEILVLQSTTPYITPEFVDYDLTNPGDVFTNIVYITANEVVSISNAGSQLVANADYHIIGSWLFIHNSYLSQVLDSPDEQVVLTITFDTGDNAYLTITAIESGIINATISPTSATYYNYEFPDYQDINIVWNDASDVTGILVSIFWEFEQEQFEWYYYDVFDNGDGTALLRIYFDEDDKAKMLANTNSKEVEYIYITFEISFDLGAPAYFYMTLIEEHYEVIAEVVPQYAGWIEGAWGYSPGEEVWLWAYPHSGYQFHSWRIDGVVVSTDNPYIFIMPTHDVHITAHFYTEDYTSYTVSLSVNPANAGVATGAGDFVEGETVTVQATPNSGYQFLNWTNVGGSVVSTNSIYSFVMPAQNVSLTANFDVVPVNYTLTLVANPSAGGSVSGGGTYEPGTSVTVSATVNSGYQFINWTDAGSNVVSNTTSFAYIMPASDVTLTANFQLIPTYSVTFVVQHGSTLIEGATVSFNSSIYTTTAQGTVVVDGLHNGVYSYSVSKGGYHNVDGSVTVNNSNITEYVNITPLGVNDGTLNQLSVYPNPFDSFISISSTERVSKVVVANLIGQVVMDITPSEGEQRINTSALQNGVYLITIHTENGQRIIRKMVKR